MIEKTGYTQISNKIIVGLGVIWVLILCFVGSPIVISEYFSIPQIHDESVRGGQIINYTMTDQKYVYDYFDGQNILKGITRHPIKIKDFIYQYNVYDSINIPYIYHPRVWLQTEINNKVIESNVTHEPLTLFTSITALTLGIYLLMGVKHVKNKKNN